MDLDVKNKEINDYLHMDGIIFVQMGHTIFISIII